MYSIGLDVSKSTINCYIPNEEIDLAIDNNEKSLNQFYLKLKKIYKKDIDKLKLRSGWKAEISQVIKKLLI